MSVPPFSVASINNAVPVGDTSLLAVAGYLNVRLLRMARLMNTACPTGADEV